MQANCSTRSPTARITVTVSERYRLDEAEQAHRDLQGRKTVGSVVLVP